MRRNLNFAWVAFFILIISPVSTASFVEEGPYLEIENLELEAKDGQALANQFAGDFFMAEISEFGVDEAAMPSLKPVTGRITSGFGWRGRSRRVSRFHKGLDIAAPRGTPILASADGKVAFSGRRGGYGNTVILDHGGGVQTLYAHNSHIDVREGDAIKQGQEISQVGTTGRSTGPHLHYEVRLNGRPVNPEPYITKVQQVIEAL